MLNLPLIFGGNADWVNWLFALIAGIACMALVSFWFDYGMILLTTLTGATIFARSVNFSAVSPLAMFVILLAFGLIVQVILTQYGQPSPD
jgi:hypothetical protein